MKQEAQPPFLPGDFVYVVKAVDAEVHDVSNYIGRSGKVVSLDYDCGCGQEYPDQPMTLVDFGRGDNEEFWPEELAKEVTATDLRAKLDKLAQAEKSRGMPMFMERPDRWFDQPHWRCVRDHVSIRYLKTDRGDACLACFKPVYLTFPEDRDGPLGDGNDCGTTD